MRVFGHFEQPIFLELLNKIEYINVPANQFLFRVGDPDENIFIVQVRKEGTCFISFRELLMINLLNFIVGN